MPRWPVTLGIAASASLAAWYLTGEALDEKARHAVADAFSDVELCLLGPGLPPGTRPSARLRAVALGADPTEGWPARCLPAARALDVALAAPPVRSELAAIPRLAPILEGPAADRDAGIDRAFAMLRDARLPAGRPSWTGALPRPVAMRLSVAALVPTATEVAVEAIAIGQVFADGLLRVFLPGSVQRWCRLTTTDEAAVPELRCRPLPVRIDASVRFPWSEAGAPDLVVAGVEGRAGLLDLASGARLATLPSLDVDVLVATRGGATILQRGVDDDGDPAWQLRSLVPGQPEDALELDFPTDASAFGLGAGVAWWTPGRGDVPLYFARYERERASERFTIGRWEPPRRVVDRCSYGESRAIVAEGASRTSVLHGSGRSYRLDELPNGGVLSCHDGALRWSLVGERRAELHRCNRDGCRGELMPAPEAQDLVVAPVGDVLAALWIDREGVARSGLLEPSGRPRAETVLFEDEARGGLSVRRMRGVGGARHAVFFIEDPRGRVFTLAVDQRGEPSAVALRSW